VKSLRFALIFIGAVGVAIGLLMLVVIFTSERENSAVVDSVLTLLPSWSFIGTGLFAWWRRPNNRTGLLMVLVGFTWLLIPLSLADSAALFGVAMFTSNIAWLMLALLLLSFPGGRLERPWHRWLMAGFVFDAVLLNSVTGMLSGPDLETFDCSECPPNPVNVWNRPDIAQKLDSVTSILAVILLAVLIVVLVRRYRSFGTSNRAAIRPVLAVGLFTVLAIGVLVASQAVGASEAVNQASFLVACALLSLVPFAFLVGLLRSRFTAAGAVSELISTLGETKAQELDIRDALAEALGDETLEFFYWLPGREQFVDSAGRAAELPERGSGRSWTPAEHDGELIAAVAYDDAVADDRQLIKATASAAALALRNQRLEAELRANVEELRASRMRIVQTSDRARRELERNLHDGAQQHLVSMALTLRMAESKIESDPSAAKELLTQASTDLAEATTELRELARGIHPAILTDRGLGAALGALATRSAVPVELGGVPEDRLPPPVESAAYFVVAEALTNVARYSKATRADVSVQMHNGSALIEVADNGIGGADINGGTGLRGLQDRVAALDGKLMIASSPGAGTTITAELPCAQ
jgi:signal transduction histidine kinase